MTDFKHITDDFSVATQINLADVARAKSDGFTAIVCNRPDGEDPGQLSSADIAAAAMGAGLTFTHIPVRGAPGAAEVEAMREAVEAAAGPVLAYCRSGTRSIVTWSLGQAMSGAFTRGELVGLALGAGYDLTGVLDT